MSPEPFSRRRLRLCSRLPAPKIGPQLAKAQLAARGIHQPPRQLGRWPAMPIGNLAEVHVIGAGITGNFLSP